MLHLLFISTYAQPCSKDFTKIMTSNLIPRLESYSLNGSGLDWLDSYQDCKSQINSSYAVISWKLLSVPLNRFGFCLPSSCDENEILSTFQKFSAALKIHENSLDGPELSTFKLENEPFRSEAAFFLICFTILILTQVIVTLFQGLLSPDSALQSFSIISNLKKLLLVPQDHGSLKVFDGIRTLSSLALVVFHTFAISIYFTIDNRQEFNTIFSTFSYTLICSMVYSVDVFFYLSGFLMSYLGVKEIQRKQDKFSWTRFFIRRILRIVPIYYFLIGLERLGSGMVPESSQMIVPTLVSAESKQLWWSGLLLVQNLFASKDFPYLSWTWSVAVDFQVHLILSLSLYLYSRHKSLGYLSLLLTFTASHVYTFLVSYANNYHVSTVPNFFDMKQINHVYTMPVPRLGSFAVGFLFGLLFQSYEKRQKGVIQAYEADDGFAFKFEKRVCGWFLNEGQRRVGACLAVCAIGFAWVGHFWVDCYGDEAVSGLVQAVWLSCQRSLFSLGFGVLVFGVLLGAWKGVGKFLANELFWYYSKLSYAIYMTHCPLFTVIFMSSDDIHHASVGFWVESSGILILVSISFAVFLVVTVEMPFEGLAKLKLSRKH